VPAKAQAILTELSALSAIGVALPQPSLLQQRLEPASAANEAKATVDNPSADVKAAADEAHTTDGLGGSPESDLTEDEQRQVEDLKQRDREVRQHEQAHMAAAGGHARGGPSYEYTTGPDGKRYAAGGEVSIDTSKVSGDPQATIRKAQLVYRAALASAEPLSQDRSVASAAKQMEMEARQELTEIRMEDGAQDTDETGETHGDGPNTSGPSLSSSTEHGGDVGSLLDLLG